MLKTNYVHHDVVYKKKLSQQGGVWSSEHQLEMDRLRLSHHLGLDSVPKNGRALELGCGTGEISQWLTTRGYSVVGVDISESALEEARSRSGDAGIDFRCLDVTQSPGWRSGTFELVIDNWFLHCIVGDDRKRLLQNIASLLSEQGVFVGATMCANVFGGVPKDSYDPATGLVFDGDVATRYVGSVEALVGEFEEAGFSFVVTTHKRTEDKVDGVDEFYYVVRKAKR